MTEENTDTPPVTEPVVDPVVTDPIDPVNEAPKPDSGGSDNMLQEKIENLEAAVADLSAKFAAIAPIPVVDPDPANADPLPESDDTPVALPWTHKGFGRKSD